MNRKSCLLASTLGAALVVGVALVVHFALAEGVSAGQSTDQALWRKLMQRVHAEALKKQAAHKQQVHNAGLKLGSWSCVGPFRDGEFGLFSRCFARAYGPELDVTQAGQRLVNLKKTYGGGKLTWKEHAEWGDGYSHPLPIGPAPSRNETVYLYRTITCKKKMQVDAHVLAEDAIRIWINGQKVAELARSGGHGRYRRFLEVKLPLEPGANRLLVKITSLYGKRGFSFAIPLITRSSDFRTHTGSGSGGVPARLRSGENCFHAGYRPFSSASYLQAKPAAEAGNHSAMLERYVKNTLHLLELPETARAIFPETADATSVNTARSIYHRAQRYTTALIVVRGFRFDVPVEPMYDPPTLKMVEVLDRTTSPSPGGQAYLDLVTPLKTRAQAALADLHSDKPGSADTITRLADDIEKTWTELIRSVGPIAFIRRPALKVNAVSPYETLGGTQSSICVFDPTKPKDPLRVIYDDPNGAVFDMNLSYDAKTIFFSARRKGVQGGWHIYEIGVDGRGLKRITSGSCNNISPLELPSGEIMFVSSRAGNMLVCQPRRAGCLYVVNRDGSNVRRVSGNTLSDHTPQIMNNGQVLFSRWDYGVDKGVFARQALWTMNPDGTGFQLYFGNTIEDPNAFWEARTVPGRPEVVCTFGPHHRHPAGMIGLLWNGLGPEAPRGEGFRWVTQEVQVVCDMSFPWGYQDPFPINEKLFLASYGGDGERRNRVYLLDDRGNKKCIYEDTKLGCWNPLQVSPRKRPPVIPVACKNPEFVYRNPVEANRKPDSHTGVLLLQDVYMGLGTHVKRGEVKALQIMEQVPKTHKHTGGYAWDISPTIGRGTLYVRRLIGTVPVESDGSAHFRAPAIRDISFDALDAEGKVIQRMGTTIQVMPDETRSCVGCHERRGASPKLGSRRLAAKRAPSIPQRPDWGTNGIVDFVRVVQPVLDKHCAKCHSGPTPDGGVDLSGDKTRYFNMAYNNLVDRDLVHHIAVQNSDYGPPVPKTIGAYASPLCRYIESKHHGPELPLADRQRIYTWIDSNVPYYGVYHYTDGGVRGARDRWYADKRSKWFQKSFVPVFRRRCYECHAHKVDISQSWMGVRHKTVTSKAWSDRSLMAHGFAGWDPHIVLYGPAHRINLTHPEWSLALTAPLSKKAGGLSLCKSKEDRPIFKDKTDRDYQAMLEALQKGRGYLTTHPRVDMIEELKKKNKESAAFASSSWIWHPDENGAAGAPAGKRYFRRVIQADPATLGSADITITADNSYTLWVNGQRVLKDDNWTQRESASIKEHLTSGANVLAIVVGNTKVGPAGLIAAIEMKDKAGKVQVIVTDKSWVVGKSEVQGWRTDVRNPDGWAPARVMGKATMSPWQLK